MAGEAPRILAAMRDYVDRRPNERVPTFLSGFDWSMQERPLTPRDLPCTVQLERVVAIAGEREARLARTIAAGSGALRWGQTYTEADFGSAFMEAYGWTEIFGTRGHFANNAFAGGFLLLGPHITYPDHHHIAEEIYIPLTGGTRWRKGGGEFVTRLAGEIIHHPSEVAHSMATGDEPLLALYLWRGGPLDQRSTITAASP
jgi:hypothetical protein